jgi:TadE-like protein
MRRQFNRGAATVEFYLVALLALLPMGLGMLQVCLLLIDNHHIDHAAFMAARRGASHQGTADVMREEFTRVLTPLFLDSSGRTDSGNVVSRVAAARIRATVDVAAFSSMRILSPTPASQRDFSLVRNGLTVIPNDSLQYRSIAAGSASGMSVQQSNMLRVEFTYCRPLIVPFIRNLMIGLLRRLDGELANQRCYASGRVPVRTTGGAPMQSDFRVTGAAD